MQGAGQEVMNIAMLCCIEEGIGVGCAITVVKVQKRECALGMAGAEVK